MAKSSERTVQPVEARSVSALLAGVFAVLLGAFLVLGAGFSPIAVIHNATHDARHTFFPCH
jgi:cobalt transporter subunit CbtB